VNGVTKCAFFVGAERISNIRWLCEKLPDGCEHNCTLWPIEWNVCQHVHGAVSHYSVRNLLLLTFRR